MADMNYNDLSEKLKKNDLSNVCLLAGDEYLVDSSRDKICNLRLGNSKNDFNYFSFSSSDIDMDLFDVNVNTFPINSDYKCVVLQNINFEAIDDQKINQLITTLRDVPNFTNIIICNYYKNNKSKNLSKIRRIVSELGDIFDLNLKDINLEKHIILFVKSEFGKDLTKEVSRYICNNFKSSSMYEIKNELKKICQSESSDVITLESINKTCTKNVQKVKIFDLPKEILNGNIRNCLVLLKKLLVQGEEPISIISVVSSEYIDILRVKLFDAGNVSLDKLKDIFDYKSKEFRITNAKKKSKYISFEVVRKSLKLLLSADLKLKSTSLNPEIILFQLVTKLVELVKSH